MSSHVHPDSRFGRIQTAMRNAFVDELMAEEKRKELLMASYPRGATYISSSRAVTSGRGPAAVSWFNRLREITNETTPPRKRSDAVALLVLRYPDLNDEYIAEVNR